jgi:hypothetical protein
MKRDRVKRSIRVNRKNINSARSSVTYYYYSLIPFQLGVLNHPDHHRLVLAPRRCHFVHEGTAFGLAAS